jgi:hypothetical protein
LIDKVRLCTSICRHLVAVDSNVNFSESHMELGLNKNTPHRRDFKFPMVQLDP